MNKNNQSENTLQPLGRTIYKQTSLVAAIALTFLFSFFFTPLFSQTTDNEMLCDGDNNYLEPNLGNPSRDGKGFWKIIQGSATFNDSTNHSSVRISNIGFGSNIYHFYQYNIPGNPGAGFWLEHTLNVTNYKANAGRDTSLCYSVTSYQFKGCNPLLVAGSTGTWTRISGTGTFTDEHAYNTIVSGLTVGTINRFRWTITGMPACGWWGPTSDYAEVNINVVSQPNAFAGLDQTICPGGSTTLTASSGTGYTYLWNTGQITQTISVSPAVSTNYSLTVTDSYGCKANDDVDVFINNLNVYTLAAKTASYCTGGAGVKLSLSDSETGVTYQLKRGVLNDGAALPGTGDSLFWVNKTAGTYTVVATNPTTTCSKTMNGSVVVTANPLPSVFNLAASSTTYCSHTSGVKLTLNGSENGANYQYQLYRTGAPDEAPRNGTGGIIEWTDKTSGNYSVITTNTLTKCSNNMSGNPAISSTLSPSIFNISGSGSYCENSGGLAVNLDGSEIGMNYQLLKDGLPDGAPKPGSTNPLTWGNNLAGNYTIQATNAGLTCSRSMNGNASFTEIPLPTVFNLTAPAGYCAGGSGVTITLSGSQLGIDYILSKDGIPFGTIAGSGFPLTWTNMMAGSYSAQAKTTSGSVCTINMSGTPVVTAYALPTANAGIDKTICQGGGIQLNASGGNGYSWSPTTGLSNASIQNPIANPSSTTNYIVTVTDANGCSATDQVQVIVKANPDVVTSPTVSVCNGLHAKLTATDNIPGDNESYLWNTGDTNDTIQVHPSTNTRYYVTVTDVFGCHDTASVMVNINQNPGVNAGSDTKVCYGSPVTLTANGNADTWLWNTGDVTPSISFTPSITADYTLRGTFSATGCYTIDTVKVTVNSLPIVSFTLNGGTVIQYCSNGSLVALAGTPVGGGFTSTAPGAISGNSFDPKIAGIGSHTITYNYTDANTCSSKATRTVNIVAPPTVTITGLNATYCNNSADQTIIGAPLQDGNGNYGTWTFSGDPAALINNGDGTAIFKPSVLTSSGVFKVTYRVNNFAGCTGSISQNVTVNWVSQANFIGLPANICQNASPVTITGNQGTLGTFSGSGITDNGNGTATFNPSSLIPNNYSISFTYQDPVTLCQSIASKTITVKSLPTSFAVTGGGSFCEGSAGLPVGLSNSTVGVNYELFFNGTSTGQIAGGDGGAISFGNKTTQGTYTVKATNLATSCVTTMTGNAAFIEKLLPLDAQVIVGVTQLCPGTTQNYSIPAVTNATTYDWTLPANASITVGSGTNTVSVYFPPNSVSGNISVSGRNDCGSGLSSSLGVSISPLPSPAGAITGKTIVCLGETNVIYFIGAINNATSYVWTVPSGATLVSGQGTTQIIVNYTGSASSGNITVMGTNSCGSGTINSSAITVAPIPQLTVNAPSGMITCAGNQITVSATSTTGGVTFAWTGINGGHIAAGPNTSNPSVDAAGDYIVVVTEPINACTSVDTVTVSLDNQIPQNVNITATNSGVISCTLPQATLTASTTSTFPVGYLWSASGGGNIVSGNNTPSADVDKGGVYQVTIKNLNNNCISSKSITITESKVYPDITVVDPETEKLTCTQTMVTLSGSSATSGVTYNWSGPGAITSGNTTTPVVNASGTYTLVVTALNGCSSSKTVQVLTDFTLPTVSVNAPSTLTCSNPTITLNGSSTTSGATLLWTGPGILSGSTTQTPVINQPGNYTLTATHPITGCTNAQIVNVLQDLTAPVINFPVVPASITCTQTTSTLTSNVAPVTATLLWTGPGNITTTTIASPVVDAPGVYSLIATNPATGCSSNRTLTVADGKTPANVSIAAPSVITCTTPSVTLQGNTTTGSYNAKWTTTNGNISGSSTNLNAIVTKAGLYTLTITNTISGCTASQNVTVTSDITAPDITVNKNPVLLTCTTTQVELYGASITPAATLLWTGPVGAAITDATTEKPKVNAIGIYTLTVTAPNGCTSSDVVTVTQDKTTPAVPSILVPQTLTCSRTSVQVEVSPLIANSSYLWTTAGSGNITNATSPIATVDAADTYIVKVTNVSSGCTSQGSIVVNQDNTAPSAVITGAPYYITCASPTIILNGSASTGINPVWTATLGGHILSDGNTFKPTVDAAGTYTITTADATTGCTSTASVSVTPADTLPKLTVNLYPATLTCGLNSVTLFGESPDPGTTFTWKESPGHIVSGHGTSTPVVDQPGTYIFTVKKTATGCENSAAIQVLQDISAPSLSLTSPTQLTCAITQTQLNASTTASNVSYAWSTSGTGTIRPGDENVSNPVVLSIGTYTISVTDMNNQCVTTGNVTVTENITIPDINVDKNPLSLTCTKNNVQLSGNSITSGVTYQWSTAGTGTIINPTSQMPRVDAIGTYNLVVTNPLNGCTATDNVIVTEDRTAPNIWVDINPAVLNCTNTTVTISGNSSTANVTYLWSGPGNISNPALKQPTVDASGTYTLTVTSTINGCTSSLPVTVTRNNSVPAAPVAINGQACFNSPTATLTATGNGVKWYSDASLLPASKLYDGNNFTPSTATATGNYSYFVTQTDPVSQCQSLATQVTYTVLPLPTQPINTNQSICAGTPNPALQANGTNIKWYDIPGGTLLANGGLYTPPVTVSAPGTYTYFATQTDVNNCQSAAIPVTLTINTVPAKPVMDKLSATICQGTVNPSFTASGSNIKWYDNSGLTTPVATGNTYTPVIATPGIYPYYVTQTSAQGCTSPYETVSLTISALPQSFNVTGGGTYCEGQSGVTVGLDGSQSSVSYQLMLNGISAVATTTGNGSTFNFGFQQVSGIYSVIAANSNGCQVTMNGSVPVVKTLLPVAATAITGTSMVCQGTTGLIYTVPPITNATSYIWNVPPGSIIASGQGTNTITVNYGASAVSGAVTVQGSNSCGLGTISSLPVNVIATPQLTLNTSPLPITCNTPVITLTASSTTGGTAFSWTPINGGHIASNGNTASPSVDAAGDYTVTVIEPINSCSTQGTVTVISDMQAPQNVNISASNGGIVTCAMSSITLSATTTSIFPVSYSWSASSGGHISGGTTTANILADKAGVYSVIITNLNNGCITAKNITISEQKTLPDIAAVDPASQKITCTQTTVTLSGSSVTPGATFNWTGPGAIVNANTTNPIVNATGIYTFTVTAPNGCIATKTVQVLGDNSVPNIAVNTNPDILTCSATTIMLDGKSTTTGALLLWTGPGVQSGSDTETPVVNKPGLYTLTVYHPISGCTNSAQVTVTQNIVTPTVTFPVIPAALTCTSPQTTISGATSAITPTYLWTTGDGIIVSGPNTISAVVSKAGTYMLSVTDNTNGCSANASLVVTADQASPNAQIATPATITCASPTLILNGSSTTSPVNVSWSTTDGSIASGPTSFTPSVTKGGTYIMNVTNTSNGCSAIASILVSEDKTKPVISIDKTPPILNCLATQVQLNGTASNATLTWTGPAGATITNPNSTSPLVNKTGRYYLTATATNGCSSKDSTDVTGDYAKPINVQINVPGILTCTNNTLQLTGSTTTASSTFQWTASNGGNITSASNAGTIVINAAGDYKIIVIHPSSYCKDSASVSVTQNISASVINFPVVPPAITCSAVNSQLNSNVTPAGSILQWTGPGVISDPTIPNPTVNSQGTYTLTATHPVTGCITSATLVVSENKTLPDITIATPPDITCTQPTVLLDATTALSNYTAAWSTTTGSFSGPTNLIDAIAAQPGLYTLTLTNNTNGCIKSSNILVIGNNANPDIMVDPNPAKLTCTVTQVELYGSSTTTGATVAWTGPGNITDPNTQRPKVDAIGIYTLTVTGTNGCTSVSTVTVTEDKTTPSIPNILTPVPLTCSVNSTNLEVSPLLSNVDYHWSTAGSGIITNGTTAIATVNTIGNYTVRVTDRATGCTNENNIDVTEDKSLPTAIITGGPYELSCTLKSLQLNGNTSIGINPVWSATSGGHIVNDANTFLPTIDATGIYTLTVSHATSGCTHSANITVTKTDDLPGVEVESFPPILNCLVTQVTLSGQPTEAGTTFLWKASPGNIVSGESTYNPVVDQPGTYILSVTKTATGCVNNAAVEVIQNITSPQLVIGAPQQFTCTRNEIQLNASSPNTNVSYSWTTSGTGSIKAGDEVVHNPIVYTPATYTITLSDITNFCSTTGNVVVTENVAIPDINVNKTPLPLTCVAKQVVLSGNSLTPNATYLWTGPGNISNPVSKTPAVDAVGTYTLMVTNPVNGCTATDNVAVISDVTAPDIWVDNNPDVLNCTNTNVQIKGNSSTPVVSYLWSGPGNISDATLKEPFVDAPGTYQLTVTASSNGCTSTLPVTVTRNVNLPAAPAVNSGYACFGSPAATLTAIGNNIQWYSNPALGATFRIQSGPAYTPTTSTAIGDYNYYVTQTDPVSQCEGPATQVIYSVKALPAAPINVDNSICEGSANPSLQANGTNIKWYDTPGGTLLANGTLYTPPASVNTAGTYTYFATQTDGLGCESTGKAVNLIIHPIPAAPLVDKLTANACFGNSNPTFNATGTNLKWYTSPSLPAPVKTGSSFIPLDVNSGLYNYYVTQTSSYGCESPYETITFNIQPLPQQFTVTGGGVYCADQNGVNIGLSGSQLNVAYQLLLNGTTVITSMNGTSALLDFGLQKASGNYTINAIDNNTCSTPMTGGVSIITNPLPGPAGTVTGSTNVCEGSVSVTYNVSPIANASTYVWNVPTGVTISSGLNSNTITIDYVAAATSGNISVYGQNSCGIGAISPNLPVVVTKLPVSAPNIKFIGKNNAICLGDTGIIYEVDLIDNATSYEWVLPTGAIIMSGVNTRQIKVRFASNSAQGTQFVRVRGVNSCGYGAYSAPYNITVFPNPTVYAGIDQNICSGQTTLQGSTIPAGGSGIWELISGSALITSNTANNTGITSVAQGENLLTWTITENGCKAGDTVKIINNQLFVEAGQNLPICSADVILEGSALPSGTSGIWTVVSGSAALVSASQPNTKAYNFGYGDTKLYWTVTKNGCNSVDSVIITNYRPSTPDAGGDQTICTDNTWLSAAQPIYGTGQWFLYSGLVTIANPMQRNTQVTSVANGKNILVWKVTNQICSLSDTLIIWNNSNPVNAGYDQILCDNRTTLDASAPPTGATGQWSVLEGSASFLDPEVYNTKVSGLTNGITRLIWSITKSSCTNSDTITLISNMPTIASAGADQEIPSSSTTLEGNMPVIGTGKWTIISGAAVFANDTQFNTTVSGLNSGINIFRWTITYVGCSTYDDVAITNGTLETVDAGQNQTLCVSETRLEASRPLYGFGLWTVQKGSARFENNEAYNSRVYDLLPGENILRWTVSLSGIEFYDTVIIVNNKPTTAVIGPKQILCADSSALTGNMAIDGTGRWTLEGGSGTIADPLNPISKVTNLSHGDNTFRWTITKGSCVSSVQLIIINDIPTTAYAGLDQSICTDKTLLMPNSPSIGTGEWSVMQGAGSFLSNEVTGLAPGNNILRWTIRKNNCLSSDDVVIRSNKPTNASAGNNTIVCIDSIILSANKPNAALGEFARWTVMNGSGNITDTTLNNSWVKRLAQGVNVLRWTINNNGCISYDDVEINYAYFKSDAGSDITTCDNHVILNANNPSVGTGEWSIIGGSGTALFINSNSPNSEVKNLDQGTNILRWTIRNYSCVSTDEVNIINNAPSVAFAGADQNLCVNSTTLAARAPLIGKGIWSVLSGSGKFVDTSAYNTVVNTVGLGVNTYRWTVTNVNCTSTDEVVISNNMPINTFAGVDQTFCSDSTYLSANQPVVGSGVWGIMKGAGVIRDVYNPITRINGLAPDTNIVRWTVTNKQCVEYKEIKLINNNPTTASAGADRITCSNMIVMDGNVPVQGTGEWLLISGAGTFVSKNQYNTLTQGMLLGNNVYRWRITKQNCISYDDVVITNDLPTTPDAGTTISVCDNTASLNGNKPVVGTGHWSVLSGQAVFADSTKYNTRVLALGQGSNFLLWTTVHNRCTLSDVVEVKNNLTNVYAGPDQVLYEDQSMLVGNEPPRGIGTWSLSAGAGNIASPNNFESGVTGLAEGLNTFVWSVDIDGCISADQVQITYYKLPTASFAVSSTDGCPPHEVRFTKTSLDNYSFTWDFGNAGQTSTEANPVYTYPNSGTYTAKLTVIGPDGNPVTRERTITVHELPTVTFDIVPQNVYVPGEELRCYNYSKGGQSYIWNFGDGNTSTDFNPSHLYTDSGYYNITLKVTTEHQCSDSLTVINGVHVIETSSIKFPTAFTPDPNGPSDGRYNRNDYNNDIFYPIVIMGGIENYNMQIFNRWGVLIFESNDIDIGWDGYYKGKYLMEDVYIYRVTGVNNNGKKFTITGDVLLMHR